MAGITKIIFGQFTVDLRNWVYSEGLIQTFLHSVIKCEIDAGWFALFPGVMCSVSAAQKDELVLEGNDVELVSNSGVFSKYNVRLGSDHCYSNITPFFFLFFFLFKMSFGTYCMQLTM